MGARLEELSEARQGVVARVKASEREREGLDGARAAAEAYLAKDRECTATHAAIYQLFLRDGQVLALFTCMRHAHTAPSLRRASDRWRCSCACSALSCSPACKPLASLPRAASRLHMQMYNKPGSQTRQLPMA